MHTSIAIDSHTRDRAAKRANAENMPLAVVVRVLLNDYADGRLSIGARTTLAEEVVVDAKTQRKMDAIISKWNATIAA